MPGHLIRRERHVMFCSITVITLAMTDYFDVYFYKVQGDPKKRNILHYTKCSVLLFMFMLYTISKRTIVLKQIHFIKNAFSFRIVTVSNVVIRVIIYSP